MWNLCIDLFTYIDYPSFEYTMFVILYGLGAVVDMIGNYVGSVARAMLTFCVAKEEVGKIFSFLAFVDGVIPSLCQLMYSLIWTVCILTLNVPGLEILFDS